MSGQHIIIEQLREELEKAHAASEYQTRHIEHYRTQLDFCERRAEKAEQSLVEAKAANADFRFIAERFKVERDAAIDRAELAERFIATADSEWRSRAEKAEREIERLRSDAKTLAAEHFAADYRAAIARADKAEDERYEARAQRDALHVALELAEVDVALDRSWCRICRTECRGVHRGRREHVHAAECVLNIRAHAAKAVNP